MPRKGSKLVHNHSTLIKGLKERLVVIVSWPEVQTVTPGLVRHTKRQGGFELAIQRDVVSGLRCLAKNGGSIQELYIVTSDPEAVKHRLAELD